MITTCGIADKTVRRLAHGHIDGATGIPTCMRDLTREALPRLTVYQMAAAAARARFPTVGNGWGYVPDTTPARRPVSQ